MSSHTSTDYDSNGNATRTTSYQGGGTDGELFTGDDPVSQYGNSAYDVNGNRTRYTEYGGAGADGMWFSADDTVSFAQVNDPNK